MFQAELEPQYSFNIIDSWNEDLIQRAAKIYEEGLGQKYISEDDLKKHIADESCIVIGATIGEDLAGVMIAYPMTPGESEKYDKELLEREVPKILEGKRIGLIKSVSVKEKYRRRGIGTQLIIETMQRLKEKGCDMFFAVSWVSGLPDSSPSIFEALKFTKAVEISNYWTQDSIEEGYLCPVDGNPCHCSAIFFFKKV